jgi:hypothetical protein
MKTPQEERQIAEKKMKEDWDTWTASHSKMIKETSAGGKTKRVNASGVSDAKNDIMLYSIIEAESHDAAAQAFVGHPHLSIPQATIEIMAIRAM